MFTDEDFAAALAIQEQQRRLGVRVLEVAEILGASKPRRRAPAATPSPLPLARRMSYSAPTTSEVVPFFAAPAAAEALGRVMRSNFTVSRDVLDRIRESLRAEGCTPARAALVVQVFIEAAATLPVESAKAGASAADLAALLGLGKSAIGEALASLETAGVIARSKDGRARPIWVSPRYAYRGRAAMFSKVLAEFEVVAALNSAT